MVNKIDKQNPYFKMEKFWDLHIHGVAGIDFMFASQDEMIEACIYLGHKGIGFFAPTLLTATPELLVDACQRWGQFLNLLKSFPHLLPAGSAFPLGIHLEGPYLSSTMAGAHPPELLMNPTLNSFTRLWKASQGHIVIVTLAPELPGGLSLISHLKMKNIRVQLGHSNADTKTTLKAFEKGAAGMTHLFNAMKFHHRNPGLLGAFALAQANNPGAVTAELITDGYHVDPTVVLWALKSFPGGIYAVSDGCSAMGWRKSADFKPHLTLGSLNIQRRGPLAYDQETNTLAGGATFLTEHPQRLLEALDQWRSCTPFLKKWPQNICSQILGLFRPPPCSELNRRLVSMGQAHKKTKLLRFSSKNLSLLD